MYVWYWGTMCNNECPVGETRQDRAAHCFVYVKNALSVRTHINRGLRVQNVKNKHLGMPPF